VPFWFVACLYAWEVCVIDWNWVHVFLVVGLNCYSVACMWTVARTVNLAQASSSRLGESVWDPPRFYSSSSPRRKALVFELSRSGESTSPKRVLEGEAGVLCSQPRPGEVFYFWAKDGLAQASWSRPSEMLAECPIPGLA